jgi:hypothetical protein
MTIDLVTLVALLAVAGAVGGAGFALGRFLLRQYASGTIGAETVIALQSLNKTLDQQLELTKGEAALVPGLKAENQHLRTVIGAGAKVDALEQKLTPILQRNATALEELAERRGQDAVWSQLHVRSLAVLELIAHQLHISEDAIAAESARVDRRQQ